MPVDHDANTMTGWEYSAMTIIRTEMARRRMSYAKLNEALAAIGVEENERNLRNKIARGRFSAVFFLQCLKAIGVRELDITQAEV
ncbi:DUF6471 domain-containing protein [Phenylobacterium sp.]|uniref:DUF6471 domain-containing protein n=1 Tax=Phenylobacterium sp. TaxID=1871053 RepID=UPI002F414B13